MSPSSLLGPTTLSPAYQLLPAVPYVNPFIQLRPILSHRITRPLIPTQIHQKQSSQAQSTSGAQQRVPSGCPSNLALLYQGFGLPSPRPSIAPRQGALSSSSLLQPFASTSGILETMTLSVQLGLSAVERSAPCLTLMTIEIEAVTEQVQLVVARKCLG